MQLPITTARGHAHALSSADRARAEQAFYEEHAGAKLWNCSSAVRRTTARLRTGVGSLLQRCRSGHWHRTAAKATSR